MQATVSPAAQWSQAQIASERRQSTLNWFKENEANLQITLQQLGTEETTDRRHSVVDKIVDGVQYSLAACLKLIKDTNR